MKPIWSVGLMTGTAGPATGRAAAVNRSSGEVVELRRRPGAERNDPHFS